MGKEVNFGKLLHGGDYNPEQWMDYPEILEQDLAYFKKARINEVSLGMFSWAFLEPEEGVFPIWNGSKEVIDRLYENEIAGHAFHADGGKTALDGGEISGGTPHGCDASRTKSVRGAP